MIIAFVAMVVLVAVGVGSAAIFTGSACEVIRPEPLAVPVAGVDAPEILAAAFPAASDGDLAAMSQGLDALSASLGPLTGIADVGGAQRLARSGDGSVAIGPETTVLEPSGSTARAAASFGEEVTVVGDGDTLFSLALVNELTGQVDALLPVDERLEARTCVDTATVGTQLAFHLDADGGELLLFRVDEDGDDARAELRDPVAGRLWASAVEVETAPAGILGERTSGRLGEALVLVGGRTTEDAIAPVVTVVTAIDRDSGEVAWTATRDDLAQVLGDETAFVDVVEVTDSVVVALVSAEDDRGRGMLIGLDATDGSLLWAVAEERFRVLDTAVADGTMWVALGKGDEVGLAEVTLADGNYAMDMTAGDATSGALAATGDRRVLVTDRSVDVLESGSVESVVSPFVGRDVLAHAGGVSLLLGGPTEGAVAVTFGA